jgi:hypothetical protein
MSFGSYMLHHPCFPFPSFPFFVAYLLGRSHPARWQLRVMSLPHITPLALLLFYSYADELLVEWTCWWSGYGIAGGCFRGGCDITHSRQQSDDFRSSSKATGQRKLKEATGKERGK